MSQDVPIVQAIEKARAQLQAEGISKKYIKQVSATVICPCGYRGLALVTSRVRPIHFLLLFLGGLGIVILIVLGLTHRYRCPACGEYFPPVGTPQTSIPGDSINVFLDNMRKRAHGDRRFNIVAWAILGIIILAIVIIMVAALFQP